MTETARAIAAVVQAVGKHASMGHVIDVFRGATPTLLCSRHVCLLHVTRVCCMWLPAEAPGKC